MGGVSEPAVLILAQEEHLLSLDREAVRVVLEASMKFFEIEENSMFNY
jgi:hypothetical protein